MSYDIYFLQGTDGVHLGHPTEEGTLCGVFYGGDDLEATNKRTVTCPDCIRFIKTIRRVRCAKVTQGKKVVRYE
ncbi:hypothetical protein LJC48_01055 [Desulfovibrio sp. OttesenSCG-928-C06]|nr:hypothetical protein [Desulfovibrio sp. OttesenSCG-928-C06]